MKGLNTILAGALALCGLSLFAAAPAQPPSAAAPAAAGGDIPAHFTRPTDALRL